MTPSNNQPQRDGQRRGGAPRGACAAHSLAVDNAQDWSAFRGRAGLQGNPINTRLRRLPSFDLLSCQLAGGFATTLLPGLFHSRFALAGSSPAERIRRQFARLVSPACRTAVANFHATDYQARQSSDLSPLSHVPSPFVNLRSNTQEPRHMRGRLNGNPTQGAK
jgi:hypothetical protein